MSKKPNSTLIGLFTLVGLLMAGAALILLGAGKYFEKSHKVKLYFDKSVNGLQVGSDVRFGGVRIGKVSSISVIIDTKGNRKIIPVVVELTEKALTSISGGSKGVLDFSSKEGVRRAVQQGLRAGMKQQSLVTGQLYVEFDIVPEVQGFVYESSVEQEYPVVPTIPTQIDEMISGITDGLKKINEMEIGGLIAEMRELLKNADAKISELDLKQVSENLTDITQDVKDFTGDEKLASLLDNLDVTIKEMRSLSEKANKDIEPLLKDIGDLAKNTKLSLEKIDATAEELSKVTDPRSPLLMQFKNLLKDAEQASQQLQEMVNDLKRNPNSLIRGKESE